MDESKLDADFLREKPTMTGPSKEREFPPIHDIWVGRNDFKLMRVPASDPDAYFIATKERLGCDAVCVWRIDEQHNDEIFLSHYDVKHPEEHLQTIKESAPKGEGQIKVVYLTFGREDADWRKIMEDGIKDTIRGELNVVSVSDIPTKEMIAKFKKNPKMYQLVAVRGFGGDPMKKRIRVPGTDFLLEF